MTQQTNPNNAALEKFLTRYDAAVKSKSKEMRVEMELASEMSSGLAVLMSRQNQLNEQVISLQAQVIELYKQLKNNQQASSSTQDEMTIDAGGFKE